MNLEKDLFDLSVLLADGLDKPKILASGNYAEFHSSLTKYYQHFPTNTQILTNNILSSFLCCGCRNLSSEILECGHSYCYVCLNNPNLCCRCSASPLRPSRCIVCKQPSLNSSSGCTHLCSNCLKHKLLEGISNCEVCGKELAFCSLVVDCTACGQQARECVKVCDRHYNWQCGECGLNELKGKKCLMCREVLSIVGLAKIISLIWPVCESCKTRKEACNTRAMDCCGRVYCFICLSENDHQRCFCGNPHGMKNSKDFSEYKVTAEALFANFNNVKLDF